MEANNFALKKLNIFLVPMILIELYDFYSFNLMQIRVLLVSGS